MIRRRVREFERQLRMLTHAQRCASEWLAFDLWVGRRGDR